MLDGVVSLAAGVVAGLWPAPTTGELALTIGIWAMVGGVLEIAGAVALRRIIRNEWWLALSGVALDPVRREDDVRARTRSVGAGLADWRLRGGGRRVPDDAVVAAAQASAPVSVFDEPLAPVLMRRSLKSEHLS
jgi:hypothetical protein